MITRTRPSKRLPRRAATIAETAIVCSILLLLLIGVMVLGLGVFRYNQVASVAREAARWASVRGAEYKEDTGKAAVKAIDVYNRAIKPMATGLDLTNLTYSVVWDPDNKPGSKVRVTITYEWMPEAFFGSIKFTSTSEAMVAY